MCFSPEADLIGGIVVSGIGTDAIRHIQHRRQLALAALPLLFGAHQIIEAFAWWGLDDLLPETIEDWSVYAYLGIAFVLPVLVPWAVRLIEPEARRRRAMTPFVVLGAGVTLVLMAELLHGPVTAEVAGLYIAYDVSLEYGGPITAFYVIATCVPLLVSSVRRIVVFGVLNLVAVSGLAWLMAAGVISLWCAWAAVTSVVISLHLRRSRAAEPSASMASAA